MAAGSCARLALSDLERAADCYARATAAQPRPAAARCGWLRVRRRRLEDTVYSSSAPAAPASARAAGRCPLGHPGEPARWTAPFAPYAV